MRSWRGAPLAKRVRAGGLIAAACAALPLSAIAEQREPLSQFWLNEKAANHAGPHRPRPAFRPISPIQSRNAEPRTTGAPAMATPSGKPNFAVAVFGDAFGSQLARGLNEAAARTPGTLIDDLTGEAATPSTADPAAWAAAITDAQARMGRLDAAVILVGSDDGRPLTGERGESEAPGSSAWRDLYGARIERLATLFREKHVPLIWVGLPIVRDDDEAKAFADRNAIIRERAPKGGATFVDAWEAFADDNGQYSATGPDVNGQPATLRRMDGSGFTRAGARKLASFVEADLKRERDRVTASDALAAVPRALPDAFDQALSIDINAQIRREAGLPANAKSDEPRLDQAAVQPKAGPVLALTAPPLAAGGALASPGAAALADAIHPDDAASGTRPGRTDDFAWPPHS